jgi:hypothetical protein
MPCVDRPRNEIVPALGLSQSRDQVQQRGLAGTVRPDQADQLAFADRESHVAHGRQPAEITDAFPFRQVAVCWM